MIQLGFHKNKLSVKISGNQFSSLLNIIKSYSYRQWLPEDKVWLLDVNNYSDVVNKVKNIDDNIKIDSSLRSYIQGNEEKRSLLHSIKTYSDEPEKIDGFSANLFKFQNIGVKFLYEGKRVLLADSVGLGKCLLPNSLIYINNEIKYIKELDPNLEYGFNKVNNYFTTDENLNRVKIKSIYKEKINCNVVELNANLTGNVSVTQNHMFLTQCGLKKSKDITTKDFIAIPYNDLTHIKNSTFDIDTFLLAWFISEGHTYKRCKNSGSIVITNNNILILKKIQSYLKEKFKYTCNIIQYKDKCPYIGIHKQDIINYYKRLGLTLVLSDKKVIPKYIFSDITKYKLFLRNFFEAEGNVNKDNIEITSKSKKLIYQIQYMLFNLNIFSCIKKRKKRATNGSNIYRTYYVLYIVNYSINNFYNQVNFISKYKINKLKKLLNKKRNTNIAILPISSNFIHSFIYKWNIPKYWFGKWFDIRNNYHRDKIKLFICALNKIQNGWKPKYNYRWINVHNILNNRNFINDIRLLKKLLLDDLNRKFFWTKVNKTKLKKYNGDIYDLEVNSKTHLYLANNMVCHNTLMSLAALIKLYNEGQIKSVLIVTPKSVISEWDRMTNQFTDYSLNFINETRNYKDKKFLNIVNYDLLIRDWGHGEILTKPLRNRRNDIREFDVLILDEVHRCGNSRTHRSKVIKSISKSIPYIYCLSATPLQNKLRELYNIFSIVDKNILGNYNEFSERHFIKGGFQNREIIGYQNLDEISTRIAPYVLRRTREDVMDQLLPRTEVRRWVELTTEQRKMYNDIKNRIIEIERDPEKEERIKEAEVLAQLQYIRQACISTHLIDPSILSSSKLELLKEVVEDIVNDGNKMIIYCFYKNMCEVIKKEFEDYGVVYLSGDNVEDLHELKNKFFNSDDSIFLITKVGGEGLNLEAANYFIFVNPEFNPQVMKQLSGRIDRITQKKPIEIIHLLAKNTYEERIVEIIDHKVDLFNRTIENIKYVDLKENELIRGNL